MNRIVKLATALTFGVVLVTGGAVRAQDLDDAPPNVQEMAETFRFIRLAQTKKRLPEITEEKLLTINEILDVYEERKLSLMRSGIQLKQQIFRENYSKEQATSILEQWNEHRRQMAENETTMWEKIQTVLTPAESLEFFAFYEHFQRDVRRRLQRFQGDKGPGNRNRQGGKFNGPGNQRQNIP